MSHAVWQGAQGPGELRFTVAAGELAVLLVPQVQAGAASARARLAVLRDAGGGLAAALARLAPPARWLAGSGLARGAVRQVRLVGERAAVQAGLAWLGGTDWPVGRAVVLADPHEPLWLTVATGALRTRAEAQVEHLAPGRDVARGAASAAAAAPAAASAAPVPAAATVTPAPASVSPPAAGAAAVERYRVLVVDDSRTMRDLLASIIAGDPQLEVVGVVGEPERVEQAVAALHPHVVTLDIHMGAMSGVDVVRQVFPRYHVPFVMISSASLSDGNYVVDALLAGAVDYIQKPAMRELAQVAPVICEKLRDAARARAAAHVAPAPRPASPPRPGTLDMEALVAIGSSTGGIEALHAVFAGLPAQIPPVVVVQHIPAVFSRAFAERMNAIFPFSVKEAEDGEPVVCNRVLIAPGGLQMGVRQVNGALRVRIVDAPPVGRHKPAVDYLFAEVAALKWPRVAAAVLTGMGADGARGLLALRQAGARTLAQDEASSVVYGMPREAAKLGAAEKVVPLARVAETLMHFCARG